MSRVTMNKEGIFIDGKSSVVLCGSLFYYRIPSELWEDRIRKIKKAGYNCIDVYFPWNFHETSEGNWDFTGIRDVERFLKLAEKYQLWVVARPGPYICGEWDGGGLPAYLYTKNMPVRNNDPRFLEYVNEWYKRIMPIIAKYQLDNEGTILTLQVENELDFYKDCKDPKGYIEALAEMAKSYGITVPIIACVGNFGIEGATGYAEGVVPTMNFYPNGDNPKFEETSVKYYQYMAERNHPLMVTETNRSHQMLRRLMLNGTKLLGPFNQVGGTCFGFTNAINNWGKPLSFLASDYNFGGLVNGQGEVNREYPQSRLLSKLINLLGDELGRSQVVSKETVLIDKEEQVTFPHMLALPNGGYITTVTNYSKEEREKHVKLEINNEVFPKNGNMRIHYLEAPFIAYDLPLNFLGLDVTIHFSSLELSDCFKQANRVTLVGYTHESGEIQFNLTTAEVSSVNGGDYEFADDRLILNLKQNEKAVIKLNEVELEIIALSPMDAALVENVNGDEVIYSSNLNQASDEIMEEVEMRKNPVQINDFASLNTLKTNEVKHIEEYGSYTGYGNYHFSFEKTDVLGLMVHEASDICSVYLNESFLDTSITFNNHHFVPVSTDAVKTHNDVIVKTEIWGHTNFHDRGLPSLHIDSLRGVSGLTVVKSIDDLTWKLNDKQVEASFVVDVLSQECFLDLGLEDHVELLINGEKVGRFNKLHHVAHITPFITKGENKVIINLHSDSIKHIKLFVGELATLNQVGFVKENELNELVKPTGTVTKLPVELNSGELSVIQLSLDHLVNKECYLIPNGKNLKLTALYNGHLVSRLFVNSPTGPVMTGGNTKMIYLPSSYSQSEQNILSLLVEAINKDEVTELTELKFYQVKDVLNQ